MTDPMTGDAGPAARADTLAATGQHVGAKAAGLRSRVRKYVTVKYVL